MFPQKHTAKVYSITVSATNRGYEWGVGEHQNVSYTYHTKIIDNIYIDPRYFENYILYTVLC